MFILPFFLTPWLRFCFFSSAPLPPLLSSSSSSSSPSSHARVGVQIVCECEASLRALVDALEENAQRRHADLLAAQEKLAGIQRR